MERIFKIKTKSQPDLSSQYPSERRYSASIVLGLSVVMLKLSLCSCLMGGLIIHKIAVIKQIQLEESGNGDAESLKRLSEKLDRDMAYSDKTYFHYYINVPVLNCVGCFLMALGEMLAFIMGIFAWKKWYIDSNITFFFLSCSFSTLTSSISLVISLLTLFTIRFDTFEDYSLGSKNIFPISLPLQINIIVLSIGSVILSFLSTNIAYKGMRNSYPDDMVGKNGSMKISNVKGGSSHCSVSNIPVEVLNTFAVAAMIKYLPQKERDDLPKSESNVEYQQRVNNFLTAEPTMDNLENDEKIVQDTTVQK